MIAVERAEVSAIAPLAALVVRLAKRRMIQVATGAATISTIDSSRSLDTITEMAPITISRCWV